MAFKTWSAGDTLFAADLNNYTVSQNFNPTQRMLVNYGTIAAPIDGSGVCNIIYDAPFPTAGDFVILANGDSASPVDWMRVGVQTATGFNCDCILAGGGVSGAGITRINYVAVGH